MFVQWLQAYEVDVRTIRTMYATLVSAFPEVETWQLGNNDLAFVASKEPLGYNLAEIRARMAEEPYRSALAKAWRATDVEDFFAHFVADADFARAMARDEGGADNTDDRNVIEFALARSVGAEGHFGAEDLRGAARAGR